MPKRAAGLTVAGVKTADVGTHSDGNGLILVVKSVSAATFMLRFQVAGRRRDMGLGPARGAKAITLAKARDKAAAARKLLSDGIDPIDRRQKEKEAREAEATITAPLIRTFKEVAEAHVAAHRDGWRNSKHVAQWTSTLETLAYPYIGATPIDEIGVDEVLSVLRPIWTKTPETASRLRGRIEVILDRAKSLGWRAGENPARWKGMLSGLLPAKNRIARIEHQPSLPWPQLPNFLTALRLQGGTAALALEFAILTAARTGEVRGMRWSEVDVEGGIWTVPADRMKAKKLHRVPLSSQSIALLRRMLPLKREESGLVFQGRKRGVTLSDMALSMLVRRMNGESSPPTWRDISGRPIVPHGFRSTFRVWAGEATSYPRDIVETALAHTIKDKVEAAYQRSDLLERRRPLMEAWGAWCGNAHED